MTLQDGTLEEFGYQWVTNARNGGGTYETDYYPYPWRIILHEIQGSANPGMISGHAVPPHTWYDPLTRAKYQTVPLTRSAFALYQGDQTHYTNKACALQCEIAGFTGYTADETQQMLLNIAEDVVVPFVLFVRSQGGDVDLTDAPPPPASLSGTASEYWEGRMGDDRWANFNGLGSHLRTPGNDHWDTGAMNVPLIAQYAIELLGGSLAPASKEMFTVAQFDELKALISGFEDKMNRRFDAVGEVVNPTRVAVDDIGRRVVQCEDTVNQRADAIGTVINPTAAEVAAVKEAVFNAYANEAGSLNFAHQKLDAIGKAVGLAVPPRPADPMADARAANAHLAQGQVGPSDAAPGPSRIQGFAGRPESDEPAASPAAGRQMHELKRQQERLEAQIAAAAPTTQPPEGS